MRTLSTARLGQRQMSLANRSGPWRRAGRPLSEIPALRRDLVARRSRLLLLRARLVLALAALSARVAEWSAPRAVALWVPGWPAVMLTLAPRRIAPASASVAAAALLVVSAVMAWGPSPDESVAGRTVDDDRATVASLAAGATPPVNRDAEIDRLIVERDRAFVHAAAERLRATTERDRAHAERDAALATNRDKLLLLDARTQGAIAEVERIIAATGLDAGRMVMASAAPRERRPPRGGPFVTWRERAAHGDIADALRTDDVTAGLDRLQALSEILVRLPLASPLTEFELSDGFGYRIDPFTRSPAVHEGIDLRGAPGSPVYATAAGTVAFAGWQHEYGNMVEIDHGMGLATRYAHLSRVVVRPGEAVELRQRIGLIGSTGRSTGVHLHYEVRVDGRPRNPADFLKAYQYFRGEGRRGP